MERKKMALTLLLLTVSAVVLAGLAASAFAQTNSTTTDTTTVATTPTLSSNATDFPPGGMGMIMGDQQFGGGPGGHEGRRCGFGGSMENIEVSSAYNQTVSNILANDTDVQSLISQGYNVTSVRPEIKGTIGADGTVTMAATKAMVTLQNGTSGYATVSVDITNAKVTWIEIFTRTVIDKTAS